MANADKGNIEIISGSIGDLIFRIETLTSDRDTIKLCVRAAAEYDAMKAQLKDRQAAERNASALCETLTISTSCQTPEDDSGHECQEGGRHIWLPYAEDISLEVCGKCGLHR